MTISGLFVIVIFIVGFALLIYISLKRNLLDKLKILGIVTIALVVLFGSAFVYSAIQEGKYQIEYYYQITLEENDTLALSIIDNNNQSLLSLDGNTGVKYISDDEFTIDIPKYDVVYLNEYDNVYVVVFSSHSDFLVENDRFTMPDYEDGYRNQDNQFLYVINKETGEMILIQDYELIGQTIDLTSFSLTPNKRLTYTLFQPYQDKIRIVYAIYLDRLNDSYKYTNHYYQDVVVSAGHFYSEGDPSWITYYAVTNTYSVWADTYGGVHGYYFSSYSSSGYSMGYINDNVFENSFIVEGYVISYQDEIYYIGETRNHDSSEGYTGYSIFKMSRYVPEEIYRLTYSDTLEDLSTVDNWLEILYSIDE